MSSVTEKEARAYLERWRLVNEAENAEVRATAIATKFQQLATLMASRNLFGTDANREASDREVSERWARIRRALSA